MANNISDDSLYIGDVFCKQVVEKDRDGVYEAKVRCWKYKEHAVLYKLDNGLFIDLDDMTPEGDLVPSSFDFLSMEALPLCELKTRVTKPGHYINDNSLISYLEIKAIRESKNNLGRN